MGRASQRRILLVGNGGREHAIAWKLAQSATVETIFVAPGNGGTCQGKTKNVNIGVSDFDALVKFSVENRVDLVIPGPEAPLVEGIEEHFRKAGIPCFGPSPEAAQMEGSKAFSKEFMARNDIPTARFMTFTNSAEAIEHLQSIDYQVVVKADGLAGGKGVIIPESRQDAISAVKSILDSKEFGAAGDSLVIEELLEGEELSVITFSDGYTTKSLPPAQDHKRIFDGDKGPNTGGMGCYAPTPIATKSMVQRIEDDVVKPTVQAMRRERMPFVGVLFTGLMITSQGPKVLEYNVRFGDPETQTLLPLLSDNTDLAEIMFSCALHYLDAVKISIKDQFSCTVVVVAGGYPGKYAKLVPMTIAESSAGTEIFHAGTSLDTNSQLVTNGGRVIAATATGTSVQSAVERAYKGVACISFRDAFYRKDIAHRALTQKSTPSLTYAESGVSVEAGNNLVERIKPFVRETRRPGADSEIGGFGGVFDLKACNYQDPLLVSATDGVGTKLVLAQKLNKHDTVGIDLVAMNVNDLVVQGAEPLFFLDYYATGSLDVDDAASFVKGVATGCKSAGCALVGGETSEMPSVYPNGHYDTNGTAVGAVERHALLPQTQTMQEGDVLLGLASDGPHSNGYSLIRKIFENTSESYSTPCPWSRTQSMGEYFLTPTRIYVKPILTAVKRSLIKGMSHITGGGLVENVPRMLPADLSAIIDGATWQVPEAFKWLAHRGNVPLEDLIRTFNMGIGMVLVVDRKNVREAVNVLESAGEQVYQIGELAKHDSEPRCKIINSERWH